ncbi:GntR family transcriptional regulator [Paracoccus aerodenitrificans]|uniref:GntR family transcriptional regulator n=1 Tax=Paracoccus aerodenitrificans TaxID=3017781 RepID=UPI0022EFF40B|nr:GntR family transcriptional regulator [Paracoccus aerodenitrificans]WBU64795.1 GntR family transcriptional regulator [Paracoccus aerodenitrificans]
MSKSFAKLDHAPLWTKVRHQIKQALLAGRFEPGEILTLRALSEMFGTSVTPIRDAVTHLVAQGILEAGPRNAAMVPDVSADQLREILLVRTELEGRAARDAATRADPQMVARLVEQLDVMRRLIRARDMDSYLDEHRKFHFMIYRSAGVSLLNELIENLWLRTGPVLTYVVPDYVTSRRGSDHHARIVEAIAAADADTAEAEIVADIVEAANYLMTCAGEDGRIRRPSRIDTEK